MSRRPNLFIVGAPKCGTTAMDQYLGAHPDIYMSPVKEAHYFGRDLCFGTPDPRPTLEAYLELFKGAGEERCVGESSVWYLFSRLAAEEIHSFNADASIIVMLRNPVDMLYSLHSEFLYDGNEDIREFGAALAAEPERRAGRRIPSSASFPEGLHYTETVRYAEQLSRYFDVFGRARVLVVLFDDFVSDLGGAYRRALEFVGVDPSFRPPFDVVNPNKRRRASFLMEMARRPSGLKRRIAKALVPPRLRGALIRRIRRLTTVYEARRPMDGRLRERLTEELRPEVDRLAALLDRDLSPWYTLRPGGAHA